MFILQISFCRGDKGEVRVSDEQAFQYWADYSDLLLNGLDLGVDIPDKKADQHPVRVALIWASELRPEEGTIAAQVYVGCEHVMKIAKEERVQSNLILPGDRV